MSPDAEVPGVATRRSAQSAPSRRQDRLYGVGEVAWIVVICFLFGSGAAPEINESHYLTRARYFWDPSFCARDFFLSSEDAHVVFFAIFGGITRWVSLPVAAWCGRFIGWTLLATAWYRLSHSVVPRRGLSLFTALIWLTLVQRCHMSGEWIIGGVEGKVVAYALVLWGLSFWARGRSGWTWVLEGAAAAFHVLVGGWAVVMTLFAATIGPANERENYWRSWPGLLLGGGCALAGLLPALHLYAESTPDVVQRAAEIYVFDRLAHHLLLRNFDSWFVVRHVLLIVVFAALWVPARRDARFARVARIVWGAVALALIGAVLDAATGDSAWAARLMRFYWFRAADIFVPLGVALASGLLLMQCAATRPRIALFLALALSIGLGGNLLATVGDLQQQSLPAADRQGGVRDLAQLSNWQDVCKWVNTHLPSNALCLTPVDHQTFKWYAQRAELVTWKDVPQDAASIVEWSKRLTRVRRWQECESLHESQRQFRALARDYQFEYLVVRRPSTFPLPDLPVLYQNTQYAVLRADVNDDE